MTDQTSGDTPRLAAVIVEVADLERSTALYRKGFGVPLHHGDNQTDDRWTGGAHQEISWREGAYLHFALYDAKERPTSGVQLSLGVQDIASAHQAATKAGIGDLVEAEFSEPLRRRTLDFPDLVKILLNRRSNHGAHAVRIGMSSRWMRRQWWAR